MEDGIIIYHPRTHGVEWGQSLPRSAEMLSQQSVEELDVGKNRQDQTTKILNNQRGETSLATQE